MKLQVVTIDGTVIEADQFQEKNQGILLERTTDGEERGRSKPETIGFVPYERLMYVIPAEISHNVDRLEEVPM